MKECNYGRIPPCYGGKKFRIHEELEKMPRVAPLSEETAQKTIKTLEDFSKSLEAELKACELMNLICEDIEKSIKSDDMEKKTKKMTKAEAFDYLKGKKVNAKDKDRVVQMKMFDCGIRWRCGESAYYNFGSLLFIDNEGFLSHCGNDEEYWKRHAYEEISADDILSIEIIDEKYELEFNYDKVVELAKPLMLYLNEVGCQDSIRVSQYGIVHEPMSTLIFNNGIGIIE